MQGLHRVLVVSGEKVGWGDPAPGPHGVARGRYRRLVQTGRRSVLFAFLSARS